MGLSPEGSQGLQVSIWQRAPGHWSLICSGQTCERETVAHSQKKSQRCSETSLFLWPLPFHWWEENGLDKVSVAGAFHRGVHRMAPSRHTIDLDLFNVAACDCHFKISQSCSWVSGTSSSNSSSCLSDVVYTQLLVSIQLIFVVVCYTVHLYYQYVFFV